MRNENLKNNIATLVKEGREEGGSMVIYILRIFKGLYLNRKMSPVGSFHSLYISVVTMVYFVVNQ